MLSVSVRGQTLTRYGLYTANESFLTGADAELYNDACLTKLRLLKIA
jgi:hypothetical protein